MTETQNETQHYSAQIKALLERGESKYIIDYKFYNVEELIFECEYQISADEYSDILKGKKDTEYCEPSGISLDEHERDGDYRFGYWIEKN